MARPRPAVMRAPARGQIITSRFLGDVVRAINVHSAALLGVIEQPNNQPSSGAAAGAGTVVRARFQALGSNTWQGVRLDTGATVTVEKPVELRGFGATRTVNGEDQVIVPPYTGSNDAWILQTATGWLELGPRHWAREFAVVT